MLALVPRLICAFALPVAPAWDGVIYVRAAEQLARGEGYTQRALRDDAPARPSAYYPIGFPALLSVVRMLGGDTLTDLFLQCLLGTLTACAGYLLARRYVHRRRACLAAFLIALWPSGILISASWMSEPLFIFMTCVALLPLVWTRRHHRAWGFALSCVMLGASAYVRPIALTFVAALTLCLLVAKPKSRWFYPAVALVCAFAPLAPWTLRNARVLDEVAVVSTNGGTNLLIGAIGDGRFARIPPEVDCRNGLREVARDRCRRDHALSIIRRDPLAFVGRAFHKVVDTFFYEASPAIELADAMRASFVMPMPLLYALVGIATAYYLAVLGAALLALVRRHARPRSSLLFVLAATTVATAALHAATLGGDRYHLPLFPIFAVVAVHALPHRWRTGM